MHLDVEHRLHRTVWPLSLAASQRPIQRSKVAGSSGANTLSAPGANLPDLALDSNRR
jgi:hypothetical protein